MDTLVKLLGGIGLAIACGLNPYLPLVALGLAGLGGKTTLHGPAAFLASWPVVALLALAVGIDIFVAKLPRFRTLYNRVNYLIRPIAGALACSVVIPTAVMDSALSLVLGFGLAGATFHVKKLLRPELTSRNKTASLLEPLIGLGEDLLGFTLGVLSLLLAIVGGPLAILLLLGMVWWLLALRRKPLISSARSFTKTG